MAMDDLRPMGSSLKSGLFFSVLFAAAKRTKKGLEILTHSAYGFA
jgi:hypothetical protein